MPSYRSREQFGFLEELLDVVLAEVGVQRLRRLVQREDIICGFEL